MFIFNIPRRPTGLPLDHNGRFLQRVGESLVGMSPEVLRRILDEVADDHSAQVCAGASLESLDKEAIQSLKNSWTEKSKNPAYRRQTDEQFLTDAELLVDGKLTFAALILLGTKSSLAKYLPEAEIIFEYRSREGSIAFDERLAFREGFITSRNLLWDAIDKRNSVRPFQTKFDIVHIKTFNERVIREAILNAVSHRDYKAHGSIIIKQYPTRIEVTSPGGLLPGVTVENLLHKSLPRNRRLAETLEKAGLVERSGQGVDVMFEASLKEGKPKPDFSGTDDYQVRVSISGDIQNPKFIDFLEAVALEKSQDFTVEHIMLLDLIFREEAIPDYLRKHIPYLEESGLVEAIRKGRHPKYLVARRFFKFVGKKGVYTKKKGLDSLTNKELLLKHIKDNRKDGSPKKDLRDVTPNLSESEIDRLLNQLRSEGLVHIKGVRRAAKWYPGPDPEAV